MYYIYLLHSKKINKVYIGLTTDLRKRLKEHNDKLSKFTKGGVPWSLIYYEAYKDQSMAIKRENKLKHYGQTLRRLKERLGL